MENKLLSIQLTDVVLFARLACAWKLASRAFSFHKGLLGITRSRVKNRLAV